jgi:hypothetical protein
MPGSAMEVTALNSLPLNLPPDSEIYADSAYTDYNCEDDLSDSSQITRSCYEKKEF